MSGELVVVKHGSSSVENPNEIGIDQSKIDFHLEQHLRLRASGLATVEVASGAAVEGREYVQELGLSLEDYDDTEFAQQGTARQILHWEEAASPYGVIVRQALLTNYEISTSEKGLIIPSVRNAAMQGILVVINENPFASDEEMKEYEKSEAAKHEEEDEEDVEPDNDRLAARVSVAIGAHTLMLLSNVEGLKVNGKIKREVKIDEVEEMIQHCNGSSNSGKGGMKSKLLAAQMAASAGIDVVIAHAFVDARRVLNGDEGTRVVK